MIKWLSQRLQIKPGEGLVTLLMFTYIFGVLTFYYVLKPLRSGLFLKNFPASDLPYAYFLTAFLAGTLATLIFRLSRRTSAISFLTGINVFIILTLFYFRWAMGREMSSLPYLYFVYVQIVSVLSTAQFWLLAGYIFDSRQSKRIFPLLGTGAIAGAMAGSLIPGFLSQHLSTQAMLTICIAICVLLIALSQIAWRYRRKETEKAALTQKLTESRDRVTDLLRLVFGSRHLLLIIILIFLTLIASQLSDWQVNEAASTAYDHLPRDEKESRINALFGRFYFGINVIGITLQLTLTGFIIRRFGIGTAILFLPLGLFISSVGVFIYPVLWATILNLGSNSVFRYSIHRVGMELLYMPLSPETRKKIKVFIDVFIDRLGRAVAGLIIIALTSAYFPFGLRGTATAIFVISGICVAVSLWLRNSYVEAFRQRLARREVDLSEVTRYVTDPSSVALLTKALESTQERQILYSLGLLQSSRGYDFASSLLPLLNHESPFIRQEALRTLAALPQDYPEEAEGLLSDPSDDVRAAAVAYLCSPDRGKTGERLRAFLEHENTDIRLSAARCAAEEADPSFVPSIKLVRGLMAIDDSKAIQAHVVAAQLAARLPASDSVALLRELLHHDNPEVAAAAARAAGRAGHVDLLFEIVPMLAAGSVRKAARIALVQYGPRIAGTLGDVLSDGQQPINLRREIPWVLSQFQSQRASNTLAENLSAEDPLLKYQVVKALNRLNERSPELILPRTIIAERVYSETKSYYQALVLCQSLGYGPDQDAKNLLTRALRERLDQNLEIIFRLLGLQYSQRDIYFAYSALKDPRSERRTSAIEFLDNLLQKDLKSIILPLVEESSAERLIDYASRLFGLEPNSRGEALRLILQQRDVWLRACALHEIGATCMKDLLDICRRLADDPEPLIRETAEWACKRCA
jgi:HEAT repeat protein/MFS family permease